MKNMIYLSIALIITACGREVEQNNSNTIMVPKCEAFVFTDYNYNVKSFSDPRVTKACKNGQEWRGLYVVKSNNDPNAATLCGFWVINQALITLESEELPQVDMSQYGYCE